MSRFQKLSHVLWCCQYHIIWVPKFRYRVLRGPVGEEVLFSGPTIHKNNIILPSSPLGQLCQFRKHPHGSIRLSTPVGVW